MEREEVVKLVGWFFVGSFFFVRADRSQQTIEPLSISLF